MCQVERGTRGITVDTLIKIANFFNMGVEYFVSEYTKNNQQHDPLDKEWLMLISGKTPMQKKKLIALYKDINKHF